jgi:hypothetical protein
MAGDCRWHQLPAMEGMDTICIVMITRIAVMQMRSHAAPVRCNPFCIRAIQCNTGTVVQNIKTGHSEQHGINLALLHGQIRKRDRGTVNSGTR